jgi:hypothetical protein
MDTMLEKRDMRRTMPTVMKEPARTDPKLDALATRLFVADGKNPYYRGDLKIRNLDELDENLAVFEHHEAGWVADWLEYLGDAEAAKRIRDEPSHFRKIVHERRAELKRASR